MAALRLFVVCAAGDDGRHSYRTSTYSIEAADDFAAKGRAFDAFKQDWPSFCARRITALDITDNVRAFVRDNPEPQSPTPEQGEAVAIDWESVADARVETIRDLAARYTLLKLAVDSAGDILRNRGRFGNADNALDHLDRALAALKSIEMGLPLYATYPSPPADRGGEGNLASLDESAAVPQAARPGWSETSGKGEP